MSSTQKIGPLEREKNKKVTSRNSGSVKGLLTDFVTSLSHFLMFQRSNFLCRTRNSTQNLLTRKTVFLVFHIFKIRGAIKNTANYQLRYGLNSLYLLAGINDLFAKMPLYFTTPPISATCLIRKFGTYFPILEQMPAKLKA